MHRYFSGEVSMRSISYYFLRGETTVRNIIETTAKTLWEVLQPLYMPIPNQIMWKTIADRYNELWNFPNCVGSIDGKHIRIKAPVNSGSSFFDYKGYFSIVLMATADAEVVSQWSVRLEWWHLNVEYWNDPSILKLKKLK